MKLRGYKKTVVPANKLVPLKGNKVILGRLVVNGKKSKIHPIKVDTVKIDGLNWLQGDFNNDGLSGNVIVRKGRVHLKTKNDCSVVVYHK